VEIAIEVAVTHAEEAATAAVAAVLAEEDGLSTERLLIERGAVIESPHFSEADIEDALVVATEEAVAAAEAEAEAALAAVLDEEVEAATKEAEAALAAVLDEEVEAAANAKAEAIRLREETSTEKPNPCPDL